MSDTPETDGEWNRIAYYDHPYFEQAIADLARKLERERDEARFDLAFRRELNALQEQQLSEMRNQLAEATSSCHIWQKGHSEIVEERDGYYNELLTKRGLCKIQERIIDDWKAEAERWRKLCAEQRTTLQENGITEYGN